MSGAGGGLIDTKGLEGQSQAALFLLHQHAIKKFNYHLWLHRTKEARPRREERGVNDGWLYDTVVVLVVEVVER